MSSNQTVAPLNRSGYLDHGLDHGPEHGREDGSVIRPLDNRGDNGAVGRLDSPLNRAFAGPALGTGQGSCRGSGQGLGACVPGPLLATLVGLVCALAPEMASAHLVSTRFGELYSGILHPITALAHIVPWLALGLLGGLQSPQTARHALLVFPLAVLGGLLLARFIPGLPFVVTFNLFTFILLGGLVALALELGSVVFVALVALVGLSHGYANAAEGLSGGPWLLFILGVGLAAYVVITLITSLAHVFSKDRGWARIALRAIGSWIAAAGTMYLGFLALAPQAAGA